jgi:hypothetical protein
VDTGSNRLTRPQHASMFTKDPYRFDEFASLRDSHLDNNTSIYEYLLVNLSVDEPVRQRLFLGP